MAIVLAAVAGYVDAVGYLALNLFPAHMSGNTARLGVFGGQGFWTRAAPSGFAVAVFVITIGVSTVAMELMTRTGWRSPGGAVLLAETVLLIVLAVDGQLTSAHGTIAARDPVVYYPLAAAAVAAMGLQTTALQRVSGKTVRTTYVSGMLTDLAEDVAAHVLGPKAPEKSESRSYLRDELELNSSGARIRLIGAIWCSYAGAAIFGSYVEGHLQLTALVLPIAALVAMTALELSSPMEQSS